MILVWTGLTKKLGEHNQNFLYEENETEMNSQKSKTEWKFRMSLYLNICAMITVSNPLQQDDGKLSVSISARE